MEKLNFFEVTRLALFTGRRENIWCLGIWGHVWSSVNGRMLHWATIEVCLTKFFDCLQRLSTFGPIGSSRNEWRSMFCRTCNYLWNTQAFSKQCEELISRLDLYGCNILLTKSNKYASLNLGADWLAHCWVWGWMIANCQIFATETLFTSFKAGRDFCGNLFWRVSCRLQNPILITLLLLTQRTVAEIQQTDSHHRCLEEALLLWLCGGGAGSRGSRGYLATAHCQKWELWHSRVQYPGEYS